MVSNFALFFCPKKIGILFGNNLICFFILIFLGFGGALGDAGKWMELSETNPAIDMAAKVMETLLNCLKNYEHEKNVLNWFETYMFKNMYRDSLGTHTNP